MPSILIKAGQASTVSPEGLRRSMRVGDLVRRAAPEMLDTGELVLPDGVKSVRSRGRVTILVHETPTRVWNLRWIAEDSPTHFGPGTKYRTVRIALPYIVVVATFQRVRGRLTLSKANECFFRTRPMTSLTEPGLCYPALLNCSRSVPDDGKSLAWLCTQYLERRAYETEADTNQRVRLALSELLRTLLGTSFNRSSEFHETNSWYAESVKRRVDPRIETIEKWEAATAEDPLFVLEVPWIPVERTLAEVIDRIFGNLSAREDRADSASDLARIIFNQPVQE